MTLSTNDLANLVLLASGGSLVIFLTVLASHWEFLSEEYKDSYTWKEQRWLATVTMGISRILVVVMCMAGIVATITR